MSELKLKKDRATGQHYITEDNGKTWLCIIPEVYGEDWLKATARRIMQALQEQEDKKKS